jgi:hypothetical protein
MNNHRQIWNEFCTTHNIATNKVPLFETSFDLAAILSMAAAWV